jgi:type I restriction enzyme M protein
MLLHDVDDPKIFHQNSLSKQVRDYKEKDKFDIVIMNPPYGGNEIEGIKLNFPVALRSSETADLFMSVIMYRMKNTGRAAVILPDGFLFGDNVKQTIKEKLFSEFNVHTIVRIPHSVFAPYTSITTNILFFEKTSETKETWFYRLDMPEGYKNFSKTKPMKLEHFQPVFDWWDNRVEINVDGFDKSKKYTINEIKGLNYNIDLCGFPHEEEEILEPEELIHNYKLKRESLHTQIDKVIGDIEALLGGSIYEG